MEADLLRVQGLSRHFETRAGVVRAVDGVGFSLRAGQTLGIVGESGCGKTTTARLLLRLEDPTAGEIRFRGERVDSSRGAALRAYRRQVQAVFQDPYGALNPRMRVGDIIGEPLAIAGEPRETVDQRVLQMMAKVGLDPLAARRFPHEFSGGQRQRIAIARGLVLQPALLVLDEPVSALDVSIRGQVLNLLLDLQDEMGVAYVLISHDLDLVFHVCHELVVMYLGQVVESGPAEEIAARPRHPYTRMLMDSRLPADPSARDALVRLPAGEPPSPLEQAAGCRFQGRCPHALPVCAHQAPLLSPQSPGHLAACHALQTPVPA